MGESGTRTWRGRQGQARQGLEDHVGKVGLYLKAKRNGRVMYFNLCVQDCGGSEILCYLQIHELICYRLTDPDGRLLGETKSFPLAAKAVLQPFPKYTSIPKLNSFISNGKLPSLP